MLKKDPTIAIIDSGIGGVSVLKQLINKFKAGNYIYFADNLYMPYGNKSKTWVKNRIDNIIKLLNEKYKVDYIIIACNTASASINKESYKNVITMNFANNLTYFATRLTKLNLSNTNVIADNSLAKLIEANIFDKPKLNRIVKQHIKKYKLFALKTFVLGCTHYELVKDIFEKYCPDSEIINNSSFIINQIDLPITSNSVNVAVILTNNSNSYANKILKLIRD